jgi:integrase
LTKLFENSQLEVLGAFKRGSITIEQLVEADRMGRLRSAELLADMSLRQPLWHQESQCPIARNEAASHADRCLGAVAKVMADLPENDTTRRYVTSFNKLRRAGARWLPASAKVSDLDTVNWRDLRTAWEGSGSDWNHLRRAISKFLSVLLGDVHHPFRRAVMKRIPLEREVERVPELTVEQFWSVVWEAPEHARASYVVLAATGMRLGEYLRCTQEHLRHHTKAIAVPGTKTARSSEVIRVGDLVWSYVEIAIPSPQQAGWLRKYWRRACRAAGVQEVRLHDLRHLFAQVADEEGATLIEVQSALRHADPAMAARYGRRRDSGRVGQLVGNRLAGAREKFAEERAD